MAHQKEPSILVEVKFIGQISGNSLNRKCLNMRSKGEKALDFEQGKTRLCERGRLPRCLDEWNIIGFLLPVFLRLWIEARSSPTLSSLLLGCTPPLCSIPRAFRKKDTWAPDLRGFGL